MKKILSSVVISTALLAGISTAGAQTPDLSALGGTTTETTATDTGATTNSTATDKPEVSGNVEVAAIKIIPSLPNVEADSKTPVEVIVLVETKTAQKLSDKDIDLVAEVLENEAGNKGEFKVWNYSEADQFFKFSYMPGTEAGSIKLSVKATSKTNPENTVTESTTIVVVPPAIPVSSNQPTDTKAEPTVVATGTNVDKTDTMVEPEEKAQVNEEKTDAIKIVKTEVLDLNRIKVSFDHKIALSDNPLDMVSIESVKEKTPITLSNITLGADEKSFVILTKDPLQKEEYHVTVKTVVDGETMKAVSLANGVTTVSGASELLLLLAALIASTGFILARRKQA